MTSAEPPASPDPGAGPAPRASPAVGVSTVGEVARHTASLNLPPRHWPPPVIPADAYWVARPPD